MYVHMLMLCAGSVVHLPHKKKLWTVIYLAGSYSHSFPGCKALLIDTTSIQLISRKTRSRSRIYLALNLPLSDADQDLCIYRSNPGNVS